MRVIDTSAWIEWLADGPLAAEARRRLPDPDAWVVPTMVLHEAAKWLGRERGDAAVEALIAFCQTCLVVPLDADIAVEAARLGRLHRLATADAIIYATARATGAELLTCDAHFDGLDGVDYLSKPA